MPDKNQKFYENGIMIIPEKQQKVNNNNNEQYICDKKYFIV